MISNKQIIYWNLDKNRVMTSLVYTCDDLLDLIWNLGIITDREIVTRQNISSRRYHDDR